MFVYKFEKGTIRTGVKMNHIVEDEGFFKEDFGDFLYWYDDRKHSKEELEPVYAFISTKDEESKLVLTKDLDEAINKEESGEYELTCMDFVLDMCEALPINFYSSDGLISLVEEEYISDTKKLVNSSKHICVSL